MPEGPGADVFDVGARVAWTLVEVTGRRGLGGRGVGSVGRKGMMGKGLLTKKWA